MDTKLAELLGLMAGDGCLSNCNNKNVVYIAGHKKDDLEYHKNVTTNLFKEIFDKKVNINFRTKQQALFIRFSDKKIFNELAKYLPIGKKYGKLELPKEIIENKEYLFAFIRGLVDTDGCMVLSKQHRKVAYYPRIEISSKSKKFLQEILLELKNNGFYGSVSHKGKQNYRLEFPGIKNLNKWLENINFGNNKHLEKIGRLPK